MTINNLVVMLYTTIYKYEEIDISLPMKDKYYNCQ